VILLAYYGDDFTGSTDVLEALTASGVATVLFTEPPSQELLARFPHVRALGIAGNSRAMSPDEMEQALPVAFASLVEHRPAIVHYKVCSTFDSSPRVGSIGRAIDIGHRVFQNRFVPLVVGAPSLQRFCVFGNLFARSGLDSPAYRLDRHPTMRHHPVTPMTEADLRVHLAHQTNRPIELFDVLMLDRDPAAWEATPADGDVVLFDTLTSEHLATIGRLIWEAQAREQKPLFVAGSSGIEYALTSHWQTTNLVSQNKRDAASPQPVDRALVMSGSCSPVTDRQIAWALAHGFAEVPLDTTRLLQSSQHEAALAEIAELVVAQFDAGRSVIVHTSRGPDDDRIAATQQFVPPGLTSRSLGGILGRILGEVLRSRTVARVAITGGDTSGYVAREIGIDALEMAGPLAPGAPLCVAHSRRPEIDGVEFTFKGGQVGHDDFFGSLLRGGPNR